MTWQQMFDTSEGQAKFKAVQTQVAKFKNVELAIGQALLDWRDFLGADAWHAWLKEGCQEQLDISSTTIKRWVAVAFSAKEALPKIILDLIAEDKNLPARGTLDKFIMIVHTGTTDLKQRVAALRDANLADPAVLESAKAFFEDLKKMIGSPLAIAPKSPRDLVADTYRMLIQLAGGRSLERAEKEFESSSKMSVFRRKGPRLFKTFPPPVSSLT